MKNKKKVTLIIILVTVLLLTVGFAGIKYSYTFSKAYCNEGATYPPSQDFTYNKQGQKIDILKNYHGSSPYYPPECSFVENLHGLLSSFGLSQK